MDADLARTLASSSDGMLTYQDGRLTLRHDDITVTIDVTAQDLRLWMQRLLLARGTLGGPSNDEPLVVACRLLRRHLVRRLATLPRAADLHWTADFALAG